MLFRRVLCLAVGAIIAAVVIMIPVFCKTDRTNTKQTETADEYDLIQNNDYVLLDGRLEYKVYQGGDGFSFVNVVKNTSCDEQLYLARASEIIVQKRVEKKWETVDGATTASAQTDILRAGENPYWIPIIGGQTATRIDRMAAYDSLIRGQEYRFLLPVYQVDDIRENQNGKSAYGYVTTTVIWGKNP